MVFLRTTPAFETSQPISGFGLSLRAPQLQDYSAWAELRARSREHLVPWEPMWPRDDLSKPAYRRRLRSYSRDARDDQGYAFFIFDTLEKELLGGITLSSVRRGVTQSAMLGYWMGSPHAHRGTMTHAVACLIPYVFNDLRLHRLEAATQPSNAASIRVLEKNGFVREGYARSYLKINGAWQDHLLYALLAGDTAVHRGLS
jgi:[ribosomal protein S5]-alanine N-acetyltransferase